MKEEFVLLLVKEKNYSAALDSYVDDKKFDKVEEFCTTQNEPGLLTQLLTKYFEKHKKHVELKNIKEAEEFRRLALKLMQNQSSKNQLEPRVVLEKIPASWMFKEQDVDLIGFLSSLFDFQLTIEENTKIAERIIQMETLNTEIEFNNLQAAYLVVREDTECQVCKGKLGFKKIRIFPHGMAFHMRCAKNPQECPITRQRFDMDAVVAGG